MAFMRRKSGVYHDDIYHGDPEPHRRRRLSKPYTNTSSTNSSFLTSEQELQRRKSFGQNTRESSRLSSPNASREVLRYHLFTSTSDLDVTTSKPKRSTVALMTGLYESKAAEASSTQLSTVIASTAPPHQIYEFLNTKRSPKDSPSTSSSGSKDQHSDVDLVNASPTSSTSDQLAQDPAPPTRRTASFTPGMATRKPSTAQEVIQEETESALGVAAAMPVQKVKKVPVINAGDGWATPPRDSRSGTPTGLEYGQIGRLGLGSLRVVNGTSSPAPSDLVKKPVWLSELRRDTSSVYPESEMGTIKSRKTVQSEREDESFPNLEEDESRSKAEIQRAFSFKPGSEARLYQDERKSSQLKEVTFCEEQQPQDMTKRLAEDYIADLPMSPFAEPKSPSLDESVAEEEKERLRSPNSTRQELAVPSSSELIKTDGFSLSRASVVRYDDRKGDRRSFFDETLGSSPISEQPDSPVSSAIRPESPVSFFSVVDSEAAADEFFKSAVEIQPARSRSRSRSPRKQQQQSPLKQVLDPHRRIPQRNNTNSDSGYSSKTSISTTQQPTSDDRNSHEGIDAEKQKRRGLRLPFQRSTPGSAKGVLVNPTPPTRLPRPSFAVIESASALTLSATFDEMRIARETAAPIVGGSKNTKERPLRKKLQKLRRKSTADIASELVIQTLASVECFNVPPVSPTTRENLAQRSEAIPELERTFKTQNHTASPAASTLSLVPVIQDVRFPSPGPEEGQLTGRVQSRPRTRKRSLSRPRTWFSRSKDLEDKPANNYKATLADFGSAVELLGDNPYDMASGRSRQSRPLPSVWDEWPTYARSRTSPSNTTTSVPRPRSMMDDQTAADLSKMRRRSAHEKSTTPPARHSFDDRGGVPGKLPFVAQLSVDAPPVPAVPSQEEINRRLSHRYGYATHPSPLPYMQASSPMAGVSNEAPPPPLHSPRPMYIDHADGQQQGETDNAYFPPRHSLSLSHADGCDQYEQVIEDDDAPPPPCHSPRPQDITDQYSREVSWSQPADAWEERRKSASAALRSTWSGVEQYNEPKSVPLPDQGAPSQYTISRKPLPRQTSHPEHQQWQYDYYQDPDYNVYSSQQQQYSPSEEFYTQPQPYSPNEEAYVQPHQRYYNSRKRDEIAGRQPHERTRNSRNSRPAANHLQQPSGEWRPRSPCSNKSHHSPTSYTLYADDYPQPVQMQPRAHTFNDTYCRPQSQGHQRPRSRSRSRSRSRPTSRHSHHAHNSHHSRCSLAEELHPEYYQSAPRSPNYSYNQEPHLGRYSGGLEYNYDRYSQGFDGSAGTRSASTARGNVVHPGKRASWLDMEAYGVDFGDVPHMSVPVGATGSRMVYH